MGNLSIWIDTKQIRPDIPNSETLNYKNTLINRNVRHRESDSMRTL